MFYEGLTVSKKGVEVEVLLRSFELLLLEELGYGIDLEFETISGDKIRPEISYEFDPSLGFTKLQNDLIKSKEVFLGKDILNFASGDLTEPSSRLTSKKIMRLALDYHLGNKSINIRKYLSKK